MSSTRIVGGWIAIFAVVALVLGSIVWSSQGELPYIQIDQSLIPPFWG
jgi:hypothetical protein